MAPSWAYSIPFIPTHPAWLWITAGVTGCMAGFSICWLTLRLPQYLLKNWRTQSWQCLYPQRPIPDNLHIQPIEPMPKRYAMSVVLTSVLLSMGTIMHFDACITAIATLPLMWGLLLLACIDYKSHLLPDYLTLPLLWVGLLCNSLNLFVPLATAVWGACAGYVSLWLIAALFKYLRGIEGIGHGDFKLLALFGAWWGYRPLTAIVMIASLLGTSIGLLQLVRGRHHLQTPVAFGPYLIVAAVIMLFVPLWL